MYIYIRRGLIALFLFTTFVFRIEAKETGIASKKTSLGVNPAIMEIVLDEKPIEKEIQLYNLTNFALPIKTMVEGFTPNEKVEMSKEQIKVFDASNWIKIEEKNKDFILQPKESRTVKMTITQPKGASPGGHYASLIFQPLIPQEMVSQESVFVYARVATLVFMQVKGDIKEDLIVKDVEVSPFYQYLPDKFDLVLKNTGNTHLRPQGEIEIYDEIKGKMVVKIPITTSIILPGTEKTFFVDPSNSYSIKFGRYSVKPKIVFGSANRIITYDKKYFILFPYIAGSIISVILASIFVLVIKIKNRLYKALNIIIHGETGKKTKKNKNRA